MAAAKKYIVLRPFDRQDPNGKSVHFKPGATYDGPDIEKYLVWPDDGGPLIGETDASGKVPESEAS